MKKIILASALAIGLAGVGIASAQDHGGQHRGGAERIMRADANGDGRVTKEEIRAQRATGFDRMDVNKDGFLTPEDRANAGDGADAQRGQRGADRREQLDRDGDGKISRAEFVDRDTAMFDRVDANKDGAIDRAELQAAHAARRGKADKGE